MDDRKICKWYLELEGICFLNGSRCLNPFGIEGCEIQRDEIFKGRPMTINDTHSYVPCETDKKLKKTDVWKALEIKKGDDIAEWIIPYDQAIPFQSMRTAIHYAELAVEKKFNDAGIAKDFIRVFHNVEVLPERYGTYVIGVHRQES